MGIYRSNKRRYQARQAAQKSLEKRFNTSRNKVIERITNNKFVNDNEPEKYNNAIIKEEQRRNHLIALI
ncbi:9227_t:CDS:2 [Gigaspora margarita]|uniref:9227_t:CDS:1 n=1 Tax=Gigaspora margarita TaxID=4874 RepID=A0ABM8W1S3_GIGMA|nr:9227_t:CDS:2 [Gigaspora margarita]